jgi:Tol biopolymer transport system component/tRNA A-37 threonylcarbamoyl transferase component Bud32
LGVRGRGQIGHDGRVAGPEVRADALTPLETTSDMGASLARLRPGDLLGTRYLLIEELGRGAEGVVFRAEDHSAQTTVALKVIGREATTDTRLQRFRRELQNARRVTHPNVVRIYDLVDLPAGYALSMELIEGETLARRLERAPRLDPGELRQLALDLAMSLAAAHAAGVLHRDLKPTNVLLRAGTGRAVVTDFGVSRLVRQEIEDTADPDAPPSSAGLLTREGALVGTPAYMAPEQLMASRSLGPPGDLYALGLILREAATGQRPVDGLSSLQSLREERSHAPPRLHKARPDLPPAFCAVLDRCLDPDPDARYPDGGALLAALEVAALPVPRRRTAVVAVLVAGAGLAAAGVVGGLWRGAGPTARQDGSAILPGSVGAAASGPGPAASVAPVITALRRVTFEPGCEAYPTFAPDGATLVFDSDAFPDAAGHTHSQLMALDLASGARRRLTHTSDNDYNATLSPDGRQIAYFHGDNPPEIRLLPVEGDAVQAPLTLEAAKSFAWASDGTLLVGLADGRVVRWTINGAVVSSREVSHLRDGFFATGLAPLGDGRLAALWRRTNETPSFGWISPDGQSASLGDIGTRLADIHPGPTGALIYHGRLTSAGAIELVSRPASGGPPQPLPGGVAPRGGFAFAADGTKLAYSTCNGNSLLMRLKSGAKPDDLAPRSDWDDFSPTRVDDRTLLLSSTRRGREEIFRLDVRTGATTVVAGEGSVSPSASPDGKLVVFSRVHAGLRVVPIEGGEARVLTEDPTDNLARFDRTGASVVFQRTTAEGKRIFVIPGAGGAPRPLTGPGAICPAPSPVADRVAYLTPGERGGVRLVGLDGTGDAPVRAPFAPGAYRSLRFSPDGKRLMVIRGEALLEAAIDSAAPPTVRARVDGSWNLSDADYAPDGDGFIAAVLRYAGDVWIADGQFP